MNTTANATQKATFAGGCFWCTEAVFLELDGVESIQSGYMGGRTINPTYTEICSGETGHAEAIEIVFDQQKIDYETLLRVFFATHDPTTMNRQGNDVGTQYRSEIFYHNDAQRESAQAYIDQLNQANHYGKRLVTKLSPATTFYVAEDYHQNYYNRNKDAGYCAYVVAPKVEKVRSSFAQLTK
jgi:peptide-methionine (S)-S-oxide reductase